VTARNLSDDSSPAASPGRDAALFVWGLWALAGAVVLGYSLHFARDVPVWDDTMYVPLAAGDESFSFAWLFRPHLMHFMPLPHAVELAMLKISGGDFRVGAFFDAAALVAVAAGLVLLAKRLRGHTTYADAALVLATLHLGQRDALCWSAMVQNVLPTALLFGAMYFALRGATTGRGAAGLAACVVALPLCGGAGLCAGVPIAVWTLVRGWTRRRESLGRFLVAEGAGALAIAVVNVTVADAGGETVAFGRRVAVGLQVLGQSAGAASSFGWYRREPLIGWPPPVVTFAVVALLVATCVPLVRGLRRGGDDAIRAGALVAVVAAVVAYAAGVARTRAHMDVLAGLQSRYATLPIALFWAAHFAWDEFGAPAGKRFVQATLLVGLSALWAFNATTGWDRGVEWRTMTEGFAADVRSGMPTSQAVERFAAASAMDVDEVRAMATSLERARLGPFRAPR
jgi:hypothetical protein